MNKFKKFLLVVLILPTLGVFSTFCVQKIQHTNFHNHSYKLPKNDPVSNIEVKGNTTVIASAMFYGFIEIGLGEEDKKNQTYTSENLFKEIYDKTLPDKEKITLNAAFNYFVTKENTITSDSYTTSPSSDDLNGLNILQLKPGATAAQWNYSSEKPIQDATNFLWWVEDFFSTPTNFDAPQIKTLTNFNYQAHNNASIYGSSDSDVAGQSSLGLTTDEFQQAFSSNLLAIAQAISSNPVPTPEQKWNSIYKESAIFNNFSNLVSANYFSFYHNSANNLNTPLKYSVIYLQYWNQMYAAMSLGVPINNWYSVKNLDAFIQLVNAITSNAKPLPGSLTQTDFNGFLAKKLFQTYMPFLTDDSSSNKLQKLFIFDWFPSAKDIFQKAGIQQNIDKNFINKTLAPQDNINSLFDAVDNIIPSISEVNDKILNYLTYLYNNVSSSLQNTLASVWESIQQFKKQFLAKKTTDDLPSSEILQDIFQFANRYSSILYSQTLNYFFDHNKTLPPDPWGTKINPIQGSNIMLFVLIIILVLFFIGYLIVNFIHLNKEISTPFYKNLKQPKLQERSKISSKYKIKKSAKKLKKPEN